MEEASDVESGSQSEGEHSQGEQGEDDVQEGESEEEEEDKENEPLEASEQEEEEQPDIAQEAPATPASPSRAVSVFSALGWATLLSLLDHRRFVDPWWRSTTPLSLSTAKPIEEECLAESRCRVSVDPLFVALPGAIWRR